MNHLNIFKGRNENIGHENRLTWALMNLFRVSPIALMTFIDLVRNELSHAPGGIALSQFHEHDWFFQTQAQKILAEEGRLVSVGITAEGAGREGNVIGMAVKPANRVAIYDGVVSFIAPDLIRHERESLTLIIECKLGPEVDGRQLMPSKSSINEDIEVDETPVIIKWRDVLSALIGFEKREVYGKSERVILQDFIGYICHNHPHLNPFDRLDKCRGNEILLQRRCNMIMDELTKVPGLEKSFHGSNQIIRVNCDTFKQIWIYPEKEKTTKEWKIVLEIYPGDTMNQAREFWKKLDACEFLHLRETANCILEPNLHISFISTNVEWAKTKFSIQEYVEYWKDQDKQYEITQLRREHADSFRSHWECYYKKGMISKEDIEKFEEVTTKTKRETINFIPGVRIYCSWSAKESVELDNIEGKLASTFKDCVRKLTSTWNDVPDFANM